MASTVEADLSRLLQLTNSESERFEAVKDGGGKSLCRPDLILTNASLHPSRLGVRLLTGPLGGGFEVSAPALLGEGDLYRYQTLLVRFRLLDLREARALLTLVGARGLLEGERSVSGEDGNTVVSVDLNDLPLTAGIRSPYEALALRFHVAPVLEQETVSVEIDSISLVEREVESDRVCVDRFGQRASAAWPSKVHAVKDLHLQLENEQKALMSSKESESGSRFSRDRTRLSSGSGFFRVAEGDDGRFWFIDPDGYRFWSLGVTCVRVSAITDSTPVKGREYLFQEMPDDTGRYRSALMSGTLPGPRGSVEVPMNVHFYRWNVLRKFGSLRHWRTHVYSRLKSLGINTIGSWSEERLLRPGHMPYTRFLSASSLAPELPKAGRFPDVFDVRWQQALERLVSRVARKETGNPWLIGYFVDNEYPWASMDLLSIDSSAALRSEFASFLLSRFKGLEALNQALGTSYLSEGELRLVRSEDYPVSSVAKEAMADFQEVYAERYFQTVARILKRYDPDHLYLGCRFVKSMPAEAIVNAAGRHVDVLSVNCYSPAPEWDRFQKWHRAALGKPILIGEFHFPLKSSRQCPPLYPAFTPEEREAMVEEYIRSFASMPFSLGCHWFQHSDQPLTGRGTNGENQTIGLVDITDRPHNELARGFRQAGASIYRWHEESSETSQGL